MSGLVNNTADGGGIHRTHGSRSESETPTFGKQPNQRRKVSQAGDPSKKPRIQGKADKVIPSAKRKQTPRRTPTPNRSNNRSKKNKKKSRYEGYHNILDLLRDAKSKKNNEESDSMTESPPSKKRNLYLSPQMLTIKLTPTIRIAPN